MSTETRSSDSSRRARTRRRRARVFAGTFVVVAAALAVVGLVGGAASVAQGPRITEEQVDPAAAAAASGSRLIITTTQSLAKIHASQVTVTPATPFVVDTSGRSVGVRFALPLWDDTRYRISIARVTGIGGGPAAILTRTFRTPPATVFVLRRATDGSGDTIVRAGLDGTHAVTVFKDPHIEDFRATASHLVVSVRTADNHAALIVTDLDGKHARRLALPGDGFVSQLQSADRGDLIGYTYSDADLSASGGRESMLFTASLKDAARDDKPKQIALKGADPRVSDWRFVPDTDSILLLSFDGSLLLTSSNGGDPTALGKAVSIDGIARGSSKAIVTRANEMDVIDLTDAKVAELISAGDDIGTVSTLTPLPDDDTVRTSGPLGPDGFPTGETKVSLVGTDGRARLVFDASAKDGVLQTCISPSARYLAVLVAPDAVANSYDTYLMPLPQHLETHIVRLADGADVGTIAGSSISWCQVPAA